VINSPMLMDQLAGASGLITPSSTVSIAGSTPRRRAAC